MDLMIFSAAFAALAFGCASFAGVFDRRLTLGACALFGAYVGLDDLATVLPRLAPALDLVGSGNWNWGGKLWSIVAAIVVFRALRLGRSDVGLIAPTHVRTGVMVSTGLVALSLLLGAAFSPDVPNLETLAFQLLMPGVAEELAWRGVAPAILLGLYRTDSRTRRAERSVRMPWSVIIVTAVLFGAWHGLSYAGGAFAFSALAASFPAVGAIAYGWLRFHTGSLLFPVLAHGFGNAVFYLPSLV